MSMNAKKRVDGSWVDTTLRQNKTATDTITTFPAVLYTTGTAATVVLKGQTVQSGTPTPDVPIMPQGTGERTGNLFDYKKYFESTFTKYSEYFEWAEIQLKPFTTYTFTTSFSESTVATDIINTAFIIATSTEEPKTLTGGISSTRIATKTTEQDGIIKIYKRIKGRKLPKKEDFDSGMHWLMINEGDTALSYEPYGYKIPISSAGQTTPVYLGEVETTRRIKKLVLDDTESYSLQSINSYGIANFYIRIDVQNQNQNVICTHLSRQTTLISQTTDEGYLLSMPSQSGQLATLYIRISSSTASTVAELKEWLAAQYAAGTPVTVWYVLKEPETGIVNEPLMKIGDYADTLSTEQAGVQIPTNNGTTVIDVDTTVKPSEVSFNYAGWHTAVVHKRINGAWD